VKNFKWSSRFKRVWRKNQDLKIAEVETLDDQESIQLYQNYIASKHRDGDMYPATPEQFQDFIAIRTPSTKFIKIRYHDTLCAVSIVDYLENGLSAVYTYYDTSLASRSLGYLAILYQIKRAESLNLSYVFLGYWIKQCKKMSYKTDFRPIELLVSNRWLKAK
jgi:arginine-tRNA-protein transferase